MTEIDDCCARREVGARRVRRRRTPSRCSRAGSARGGRSTSTPLHPARCRRSCGRSARAVRSTRSRRTASGRTGRPCSRGSRRPASRSPGRSIPDAVAATEVEVRFTRRGRRHPGRAGASALGPARGGRGRDAGQLRRRLGDGARPVRRTGAAARRRRRSARRAGRRAAATAEARGGGGERRSPSASSSSAGVHQRSSNTYSALSCSQLSAGRGRERGRADEVVELVLPVPLATDERDDVEPRPDRPGRCRRRSSPASSASSRRIASSGVSPGSMPPPGVAQNVRVGKLEADEQDPVVRVEHDGPRCRSDPELCHRGAARRIRGSVLGGASL